MLRLRSPTRARNGPAHSIALRGASSDRFWEHSGSFPPSFGKPLGCFFLLLFFLVILFFWFLISFYSHFFYFFYFSYLFFSKFHKFRKNMKFQKKRIFFKMFTFVNFVCFLKKCSEFQFYSQYKDMFTNLKDCSHFPKIVQDAENCSRTFF